MSDTAYRIDPTLCIECGQCRRFCPVPGAIIINADYQHAVVADACTGCGLCEAFCPVPNALVALASDRPRSRVRMKLLRRVYWRANWHFHDHPLLSPLLAESHRRLRVYGQAARQRAIVRQARPAYTG